MANTLSDRELSAILAAQKADALSGDEASTLASAREAAMRYYLGDVSDDMPSADGRSRAVSSDVADTVEGLMPPLMEVFCSSDDVVRFEPVGPEDMEAAEQETDYINHVFMQKNPGFLVLYSFIKDALLSKVGVVKVFWEKKEHDERKTFLDQDGGAYSIIMSTPGVEVVEHSEHTDSYGNTLHDVTVSCKREYACAKVEPVPPEEFGISRRAKSIRDADYCYHEVVRTESELLEQGFDEDQVRGLPSYSPLSNRTEAKARDTVDESSKAGGDEAINRATRPISVTEHYCRMDYDGSGARLYRVTTAGRGEGEVLRREGEPDVVAEDWMPFSAMTPVIMTHRFYGRSIADLVMDIQRIKTALMRGALDNLYLHNNPRVEVAETLASDSTLDDLLVSRPGGVVRTKQPGGINWQVVPDITGAIYPALQYFDATREWRTGVTRQGQGIDADALQNQTATAANQFYSASQARVKLIARIFAETGVKDLFWLLHSTIRKHGSKAETVRLRNSWVQVDPRSWQVRNDMTIQVGLGSGGKNERVAHIMALMNIQEKLLLGGKANLVSDKNLYNTISELVKLIDLKTPEPYITDPETVPPQEAPPDPKLIELQAKNEIEKTQMQADMAFQRDKSQMEAQLAQQKFEHEANLAEREFELNARLKLLEAKLKREDHETKQIAAGAPPKRAKGQPDPVEKMGEITQGAIERLERAVTGRKRVIRDPQTGQVVGVEPWTD